MLAKVTMDIAKAAWPETPGCGCTAFVLFWRCAKCILRLEALYSAAGAPAIIYFKCAFAVSCSGQMASAQVCMLSITICQLSPRVFLQS